MKKFAALILVLFSLVQMSFSQEETAAKVYETFNWDPVANAKRYEVIIEQQSGEDWIPYFSEITKECSLEQLLEPATYRIAVRSINAVGRKSAPNWVKFIVLDEKIPYLFDYYAKNNEWNSPLLYINRKPGIKGPEGILIQAEEGMPENSLYIKGRNIFFENTEFYLVPAEESADGGKAYKALSERKEIPLTVIQRNNKKNFVIVTYDSSALKSGYYNIEARNPGDNKASVSILVLADSDLKFEPLNLDFDERYNLNYVNLSSSDELIITAKAEGLSHEPSFKLVPVNAETKYPFTSGKDRETLDLILDPEALSVEGDSVSLKLVCEADKVRSGIYKVVADNNNGVRKEFSLLVKINPEAPALSVKSASGKHLKFEKKVEVTLKGQELLEDQSYKVLSEYRPEFGEVKILDPEFKAKNSKGTKVALLFNPEELLPGKYAVIIEGNENPVPYFIEIDNHYDAKVLTVSPEEAEDWFQTPLRPVKVETPSVTASETEALEEEKVGSESQENQPSEETATTKPVVPEGIDFINYVDFSNPEIKYTKVNPIVAPYIHLLGDSSLYLMDNYNIGFELASEVDIINFRWFYVGLGLKESPFVTATNKFHEVLSAEISANFAVPYNMFGPYIGLGFGYGLWDSEVSNWGKKDLYSSLRVGAVLFDFLEFRYSLELHDILTTYYLDQRVSMGLRFEVRKPTWNHELIAQTALISSSDYRASSAALKESLEKTDCLTFYADITEVSDYMKSPVLKRVDLPPKITVIGENAFRSCFNLTEINVGECEELVEIGAAAFANDTKIAVMNIPSSVATIGENAFANWTNGQKIILGWASDDTTERDLTGLNTTSATIEYADGKRYTGNSDSNPFMEVKNWKTDVVKYTEKFEIHEERYVRKINLSATAKKVYLTDLRWANVQTPEAMLEKFKEADYITITGKADKETQCKKFLLLVGTTDGGFFEYKFDLSKTKYKTIKIPLSKLSAAEYSHKKKLLASEIKAVMLVPDWDAAKEDQKISAEFLEIKAGKK